MVRQQTHTRPLTSFFNFLVFFHDSKPSRAFGFIIPTPQTLVPLTIFPHFNPELQIIATLSRPTFTTNGDPALTIPSGQCKSLCSFSGNHR